MAAGGSGKKELISRFPFFSFNTVRHRTGSAINPVGQFSALKSDISSIALDFSGIRGFDTDQESFSFSIFSTICGLAFPRLVFMTWPTRY